MTKKPGDLIPERAEEEEAMTKKPGDLILERVAELEMMDLPELLDAVYSANYDLGYAVGNLTSAAERQVAVSLALAERLQRQDTAGDTEREAQP